jgi:hypothetical protein
VKNKKTAKSVCQICELQGAYVSSKPLYFSIDFTWELEELRILTWLVQFMHAQVHNMFPGHQLVRPPLGNVWKQPTSVQVLTAKQKKTPWSESAGGLYRSSGSRLLAKLVWTFVDRGCHVVSVTDASGSILGFLHRSRYFFQVAPELYSRGWANPVPDRLILGKSGNSGNRTRTSGSEARNSGGPL